jgi:hypothetical protein
LLTKALQDEDWQVDVRALTGTEALTAASSLLVIAGPQRDFSDAEIARLSSYLQKGGKVILMLEPFVSLPRLEAFSAKCGIAWGGGMIADRESKLMGGEFFSPLIPHFGKGFMGDTLSIPALLPTVRPVEIKVAGKAPITYLAKTSATSWVVKEKIISARREINFQEGVDQKGPVPVAAIAILASSQDGPTGTAGALLCIGDADFINDKSLGMMANKDFFLNAVNWLTGELDLIATRSRPYEYPYHYLTKQQGQVIFWLLVVVMPLLPATLGIGIYLYRRWRG